MGRWRRKALGLTILVSGVAAAWPFRQPPTAADSLNEPTPTTLDRNQLTLQIGGAAQATPLWDPSDPGFASTAADTGTEADPRESITQRAPGATISAPDLEHLPPPPGLDRVYVPFELKRPAERVPPASAMVTLGLPELDDQHEDTSSTDKAEEPASSTLEARRHTVRDGDSLESLAQRYLGDASRSTAIYERNRDLLTSPDLLPIGVEIAIPPR